MTTAAKPRAARGSRRKAPAATLLHVSFLLDETGSMQAVKDATITGYNEYLKTLRADQATADATFTLTKFNSTKVQVVHDAVALEAVPDLTPLTYVPENLTPLYDAIGQTIRALERHVCDKDRAIVTIMTDGQENASKEWTRSRIFSLIQEKQALGNWTFVFAGADQDAWLESERIGIPSGNVTAYANTPAGTAAVMASAGENIRHFAVSGRGSTADFWRGGPPSPPPPVVPQPPFQTGGVVLDKGDGYRNPRRWRKAT